jgi:hypothetical protein
MIGVSVELGVTYKFHESEEVRLNTSILELFGVDVLIGCWQPGALNERLLYDRLLKFELVL